MKNEQETQERVLVMLRREELITENQEKRLRAAMSRGMSLSKAIGKTPLVEAVKLASIQSIVASAAPEQPLTPARPEEIAPTVGMEVELDLVDDTAPLDLDGQPGFKIENFGPVGSKREVPPPAETPEMIAETEVFIEISDFEMPGDDLRIPSVREEPPADDEMDDLLDLDSAEAFDSVEDVGVELGSDDELDLPDAIDLTPSTALEFPDVDEIEDLDDDFDSHDEPLAPAPSKPAGKVLDYHPDLDEDFDIDTGLKPQSISAAETEKFSEELGSILDDVMESSDEEPTPEPVPESGAPRGMAGIPPLMDVQAFSHSVHPPQSFDLTNDEGILLVSRVNDVLINAINSGASALAIESVAARDNLQFYDDASALISQGEIPEDMLVKMTNRLKVMARIETFRKDPELKGSFYFTYQGQTGLAYVDSRRNEGSHEMLYVYLSF